MQQGKEFRFAFTEYWQGHSGITFGIEEVLFSQQSDYQHVRVLQTDAFGRLLTLDGLVMLTERDEFVYHEMIAHPALSLLDAPKRVIVIGGGDGGTVREILRHPGIEHVDLVEIDQMVIDVSREYFPAVASALDDPRLNVRVEDGAAFVQNAESAFYDLVIVDSTDPVGFAEALFGEDFYRDCDRILSADGILVSQTESPFDPVFRDSIRAANAFLESIFAHVHLYLASIPTYPMGTWSFTMASKRLHPTGDFNHEAAAERLSVFEDDLQYYNADLHRAAFAHPTFVRRFLGR
jgi:spermidine synthase